MGKQHDISAPWRLAVKEMREHIRSKDTDKLLAVMGRDYHNKPKSFKKALKWAVYYGNTDALKVLLDKTSVDHWHNALYHAVYHHQYMIRDIIEQRIYQYVTSVKVDCCK